MTDQEKLQKQLDDLKTSLETSVNAKAKEEITSQIKAVEDKIKAYDVLKTDIDKLKSDAAANQKALDALIEKSKQPLNVNFQGVKTFEQELEEKLTEKEQFLKDYKTNKKGFSIDLTRKTVGNMASATSLTGSYFVPPTVVPGVIAKPFEQIHMRDLLPVGQTNSNIVRYIQDNGGEGGPTTVAEGAAKPQIDRDLEIKDAPVRKIATYFRVPEEMIEDIPYLSSFLTQIGLEEVQVIEDTQILYGDGTGQNLTGFNTGGTAFAAGTSVIGASANEFDIIGAAKKQIRVAKYGGPVVALLNPINYYDMRYKRKDTTNNYIFQAPSLNPMDNALTADGVRIYEHTAVTAGDFFVFSTSAAAIFDRAGTSVRFYDQDQDNAIKNLVTIVIEKRLALALYRPLAIIKGTIAAAITDLTS